MGRRMAGQGDGRKEFGLGGCEEVRWGRGMPYTCPKSMLPYSHACSLIYVLSNVLAASDLSPCLPPNTCPLYNVQAVILIPIPAA